VGIVVIGEILWDLVGDQEHIGGAPFNFSVQASRLGHEVGFISAVGDDRRGRIARERMLQLGISDRFLQSFRQYPTGTVTVDVATDGQPAYVIHRPAAYDLVHLTESDFAQVVSGGPKWIYYGTLYALNTNARILLRKLMERNPQARCFYDLNLRKDSFTAPLVMELLADANVVKLNDSEVRAVEDMFGTRCGSIEAFCRQYAWRFGWWSVCVTRGKYGCSLLVGEQYQEVRGYEVPVADAIGAGDAFSAAFLHGLHAGWSPARIGDFANRLGAFVASRPGAVAEWSLDGIEALTRSSGA
jgi:fructokinase